MFAEPAKAVPTGFNVTPVATGFDLPVAVDFAPDGTMYVAEQGGVVKC